MNFGFEGKFNVILKNLTGGYSVEFPRLEERFAPMLNDPTEPDMREKILFSLLLHGGYLTEESKGNNRYRIPNPELTKFFHRQLDKYLNRYPITTDTISILSKALLAQNYTAFGEEVMKSLYDAYNKDKTLPEDKFRKDKAGNIFKGNYPLELHIHRLLWKVFDPVNEDKVFTIRQESGGRGDPEADDGFFRDFIFSPKWAEGNVHLVFELKTEAPDRKGFLLNSLVGLHQIFEKNYLRDLLPYENTKAILNIGIVANGTHLSLLTFKTNIKDEKYQSAEKLKYHEFNMVKGVNNTMSVVSSNITEHEIDIFNYPKIDGSKTRKRKSGTEFRVRKIIRSHLEDLINTTSSFNQTVVQTNGTQNSTTANPKKKKQANNNNKGKVKKQPKIKDNKKKN
jgi:hypothetical protein